MGIAEQKYENVAVLLLLNQIVGVHADLIVFN